MKSIKIIALILASVVTISAQTNSPLFIKGTMDIKYNSRQSNPPAKGVKDIYNLNVNVANSALFHGTIEDTPQIIDGWVSKTIVQPRSLNYDVACDVINPNNPSQTKNVGKLYGRVSIESTGLYRYDTSSLAVDILPIGKAAGFTSKFGGTAAGKPLGRPSDWLETLKRETVNITRSVNGKQMTVSLNKYDKMEFRQHIIAAGPVQMYQSVTINGDLLYDYLKNCWFFNNITVQYADNGVIKIDRLNGTIRWVESPNRKTNGEGEYQFDIRVNEPVASTVDMFEAKATDESAFFETDNSIPSVTGTMKYKDVVQNGTTMSSRINIDLSGNNISKQQLMTIAKVIFFSSVVPMNSD